ncbi:hypothetical protein [Carnobacterium gallinarum]|nr:hypothetical protein [Carnobacterium gallinarum]
MNMPNEANLKATYPYIVKAVSNGGNSTDVSIAITVKTVNC